MGVILQGILEGLLFMRKGVGFRRETEYGWLGWNLELG